MRRRINEEKRTKVWFDPDNAVYEYDDLGNLTAQIDANHHTTAFEYDALGRRTKRTLPGNVRRPSDGAFIAGEELWIYDYGSPAQGTKVNQIRKRDFNGRYTLVTSDIMGRVTERRPDGRESWATPLPAGGDVPVAFTYAASGQRATMTDASGQTRYAYDERKPSPPGAKTPGHALLRLRCGRQPHRNQRPAHLQLRCGPGHAVSAG